MNLNDYPTPETDKLEAHWTSLQGTRVAFRAVLASHLQLERERDEAREREAKLLKCLVHLRERDWFTDPAVFGLVTCVLDAEDVRDAIRSEVEG